MTEKRNVSLLNAAAILSLSLIAMGVTAGMKEGI